jgi:hypothetical protein
VNSRLDEVERELRRVSDRLDSLPLGKAATAGPDVERAAQVILGQTRLLTAEVPDDAVIPQLGPQGLGALVAVLGSDWLDAARASNEPEVEPVLDALITLRRALP